MSQEKMSEIQKSARVWRILEDLNWLKSTALEQLTKKIPHLEIDESEVTEIGFQPNDDTPVEEGDIIVWMHLAVYMDNVTVEQINALQHTGYITILNVDYDRDDVTEYQVVYKTAYGFTFWRGKVGKAPLEAGFSGFTGE